MSSDVEYRVLARKYRPKNFDELVGQSALVRTLTNAIDSGRIAHAFMLTGVRGVGKTTTARIVAKALNYTGADGTAGPTVGPTDDCKICQAITEDRHPDVIEMDAASRTGIDDIREIIEGVRYAPVSARYKIYIIDEVHMLSKAAFNALLKTLEEPPPHVKFIFATTEIRKVPITVLSRCQRFDLRRVEIEELIAHFSRICEAENVTSEDEAIAMLARAADGSVRDGLSLLDQAMALGNGEKVSTEQVQDMLGLADRSLLLDLFEAIMKGQPDSAMEKLRTLHDNGASPLVIVQDLLEMTHDITKRHAVPDLPNFLALPEHEFNRRKELAEKLSMPALNRCWQILMKGLGEVQEAPTPQAALEMLILRLTYASNLPDPAKILKTLKDAPAKAPLLDMPASSPAAGTSGSASASSAPQAQMQTQAAPMPEEAPVAMTCPQNWEETILFFEEKKEIILASLMFEAVHLVKFERGRIEIRPEADVPASLAGDITKKLCKWTGEQWTITVSNAEGLPTLSQQEKIDFAEKVAQLKTRPQIDNVIKIFPSAEIVAIHEKD